MRILGIDPGLTATGWGVVEADRGELRHLAYGVVRISAGPVVSRCILITSQVARIAMGNGVTGESIGGAPVNAAAIELPFLGAHGNARSLMLQSMLVGMLTQALFSHGIVIEHVQATVTKRAVTGWGGGGFGRGRKAAPDKRQVQRCVKMLLGLEREPPQDAADALAAAVWMAGEMGRERASRGGAEDAERGR